MPDGTSALATRRREQVPLNKTWRTASTFTGGSSGRAADNGFHGEYQAATSNVVQLHRPALAVGGAAKRGFDVMAALAALLLLLPLFGLIALAIKLWDRGPVFYRHRR